MSLLLFAIPPLIGVPLILAVVWLAGGARSARIDGPEQVRALLAEQPVPFAAAELTVDVDGLAALASDSTRSGLALVYVFGDRLASRALGAEEIRAVRLEPAAGPHATLVIEVDDFTCREFRLRFPRAEAEAWRDRLGSRERRERA